MIVAFKELPMEKKAKKKELLIIKKGISYLAIKTKCIAYAYTDNNITYIVDKEGKKFICTQTLNELEQELNHLFFRANRQYIININYIKLFRSFEKTKLLVEMFVNGTKTSIQVSQVTAPKFKNWIYNF